MRKGKELRILFLIVATTLLAICPLFAWPTAGTAATPDQVLVVANRNEPDGLRLAEYYMSKRGIPLRNIVQIRTTLLEDISRQSYEKEIAAPIRYFLSKNDPYGVRFKYLLLLYGIPLRIEPPPLTIGEWLEVLELGGRMLELREEMKFIDKDRTDAVKKLQKKITGIEKEIYRMKKSGQGAAVDSELALVRDAKHPLEGRLPNPYFLLFRNKNIPRMPQKVIAVSRLDGPSAAVVRRVIDDSLAVEKKGLSGKAYFDARWPRNDEKNLTPYQLYDRAIRNTASLVEKSGRLKVILDERETLFQPGQAPDAALYCGWYSLGKYVDAFTWKKGAVGYHVASVMLQ